MLRQLERCNAECNTSCSDPGDRPTRATFAILLERIMLRAGLWDASLARRLGIARSEVFRWRTGRVLPAARNRARLADVLQAAIRASGQGLPPDEQALIDNLAAESANNLTDARNRVELPDRCAVYAYQYAPRSFPSQWSRRADNLERQIHGTIEGMLLSFPTFMRPASLTRIYTRWYDADLVEQYVVDLAARLDRWRQRASEYEVRYVYSKPVIAEYLRIRRFQGVQLTPSQVHDQLRLIMDLLDEFHPNFSIALDDDILPFDATILGHEVVLHTLNRPNMVNAAGWTIFGMEMTGLSVVKTFSQAFDRAWGKRTIVRDPAQIRSWLLDQLDS